MENCEEDKKSRKFFLKDFINSMIYYFLNDVGSLRLLETELKNNKVGLNHTPFETIRDCFNRFDKDTFKDMFFNLLHRLDFLEMPELKMLGQISLVDGSHFKINMKADWAEYRSSKNGIKLHLIMNLNEMIIQNLKITKGKGNEKKELNKLVEAGITYVMDRGYVSFDLFKDIVDKGSDFVCRLKKNSLFKEVLSNEEVIDNFGRVKDRLVVFKNDKNNRLYRLVSFKYCGKTFNIVTSRLDLTDKEIIFLYACRWQIELLFNCLKNTLNGKHILSCSENGIYIQFYILSIVQLLLLSLKQECKKLIYGVDFKNVTMDELLTNPVSNFNKITKYYFKIGIHFLKYLKGILEKPFSEKIAKELAAM